MEKQLEEFNRKFTEIYFLSPLIFAFVIISWWRKRTECNENVFLSSLPVSPHVMSPNQVSPAKCEREIWRLLERRNWLQTGRSRDFLVNRIKSSDTQWWELWHLQTHSLKSLKTGLLNFFVKNVNPVEFVSSCHANEHSCDLCEIWPLKRVDIENPSTF